MPFRRLLRAATRRLRTPAATRATRTASALLPSPRSPLPLEQPPDDYSQEFSFPATTAYDPENMHASSSSGLPAVEILSTQSLNQLALEAPPEAPLCIDKFTVHVAARVSAGDAEPEPSRQAPGSPSLHAIGGLVNRGTQAGHAASGVSAVAGDVEPEPTRQTPGSPPLLALEGLVDRGMHAGLDAFDSSEEEYASGDLDSSSLGGLLVAKGAPEARRRLGLAWPP